MNRPKLDFWLIIPILLLSILGITTIRSVAPQLFLTQLLFIGVFIVTFFIFSFIDYLFFFSLHFFTYIGSILFLFTPVLFGIYSRGATRWIQFGSFFLQPSEIIKPFLLISFAVVITSSLKNKLLWFLVLGAIPLSIIFLQPDLGTSLVLGAGWLTAFLSKVSVKTAVVGALVSLVLIFPVYRFALHDYQRQRLQTFINPYHDPLGSGYHVIQSIIAVGSGQFMGRGLGHGTQSQLRFLPEHHTDFIFASLSEELGFVGSTLIIILFFVLYWRIYRISQSVGDPAASLFCLSITAMLAFQTFVNIGMNIGIAPVTGITLPFLSYGGSSLLSLGILMGLVNSISSHSRNSDLIEIK